MGDGSVRSLKENISMDVLLKLAARADGYPVNKAHMETLPAGVTVEPLDHGHA